MSSLDLRTIYPVILTALIALPVVAESDNGSDVIRFDMPSTVAATSDSADANSVEIELRLSSLIASPSLPRIEQWLVRCHPRDVAMRITDYAPRTETHSGYDGPIQVKITDEETSSTGLSVSGDYGKIVSGNVGSDSGSKNSVTQQYNKIAPVHAVTASGSIDRGRGVYFKLRWTASQVLEGEKVFKLTMRVPSTWRGGLIDVDVTAQSTQRSFAGLDAHVKTLGAAKFVIAAYRAGDTEASDLAYAFSTAEQRLRQVSRHSNLQSKPSTLPSMLRYVAAKLDLDSPRSSEAWIKRLTTGNADPYIDREISRLPMEVRVAAIEYHDKRVKFNRLAIHAPTTGS